MNKRSVGRGVAFAILFSIIGLTQFSKDVRAVQVLGLFACGIVVGASATTAVFIYRAGPKSDG
jgi:hypothetical protein